MRSMHLSIWAVLLVMLFLAYVPCGSASDPVVNDDGKVKYIYDADAPRKVTLWRGKYKYIGSLDEDGDFIMDQDGRHGTMISGVPIKFPPFSPLRVTDSLSRFTNIGPDFS
jgi:hypothetical protein